MIPFSGSGKVRRIIFTDLDGSLLDPVSYSGEVTRPLVARLRREGISIIFCSSKTRAEQLVLRRNFGIDDPFIVEDGGAVYIRRGYFSFACEYQRTAGGYHVIEMGLPYREIRKRLVEIRQKYHLDIRGFGDMDAGEIARLTGLDLKSAGLAGEREYEETLDLAIGDSRVALIVSKIREAGLHCGPGTRLYSVSAGSDKGRATRVLISLFRREFGEIQTMGIGDGLNDLTMLREVDIPVLVQQLGGRWVDIDIENIHRISEVGPRGWVKAVRELFLD